MARPKSKQPELKKTSRINYPVPPLVKGLSEFTANHFNVTEAELHRHILGLNLLLIIKLIERNPDYAKVFEGTKMTASELYTMKQKQVLSLLSPLLIEILPQPM